MKPALRLFLLLSTLTLPARAALDFLVLDSAKPGPTLIVFAPEKGAGTDALRQLQHGKTDRGRLVLARPAAETGGWENVPEFATLASRFSDAQVLVFREDEEAHSYDKHFLGETVQGNGEASSAILAALRGLPSEFSGKDWQALPAKPEDRSIVVTTSARVDMKAGVRPAVREREFRTAAAAMLRHLKMTDEGVEKTTLFPEARKGLIRVAVYDGAGAVSDTGRGPAWLRARLAREPGMLAELVGPLEILNGALDRADAIVIGGGSVTPQSEALGKKGREIVAGFVRNGGGYVGICAGAYLGSNGQGKWDYLELLPVETKSTELGLETPLDWSAGPLGAARVEEADLRGGPSFKEMKPGSDGIAIWAKFQRNETSKEKGEYALKGTPAIISGPHGKGRAVLTSTHCERAPSPSNIFPEMVRWSAARGGR